MARRLRGLLFALWLVGSLTAQAHTASDAFLMLAVEGERIEQRLDIPLRDLDRDLDLDADRDGALSWGEVRTRWAEFERLVDAAVQLSADGQPCVREATAEPALDEHGGERHAVLRRSLRCAAGPASLTLDYRLFAASDPTHRGIARVVVAGREGAATTQVLVPGAGPVALSAGARASRGASGFFASGLHHIAIGLDHVLFLVTLLLVAVWRRADGDGGWVPREEPRAAWGEALKVVTAFTVAHSLTLGLAAAGVTAPPARWVESLIAASVLVAALDNLRPFLPGPRWATVAVFGLVHGFGFAGPLQDLGLREGELLVPLLAFNLGVEAGQLVLVLLLMPLALAWRRAVAYRRWIVRPVSAAVALLALAWTAERALAIPLLPF